MLKSLARLFSPSSASEPPLLKLAPHRAELEFVLVLVEAESDQQTVWTVSAVGDDAVGYKGTVLQIMGPVIFVAFEGVVGAATPSLRKEFVAHLIENYRILVRVLHGRVSAIVGDVGGGFRRSYTAIPDEMGQLLKQLSSLQPGEAAEHVVQLRAQEGRR